MSQFWGNSPFSTNVTPPPVNMDKHLMQVNLFLIVLPIFSSNFYSREMDG